MIIPKKKVQLFQKRILAWYKENKRDLPWRPPSLPPTLKLRRSRKLRKDGLPDPYHILVSEVMLQQTQVARVIPKYEAWLKRFPTADALAKAPTREVLLLWSGLGYNRRALHLQKAAYIISKEQRGSWPREKKALKKLPGIGEYTAGAILCFAFNQQIAVVDTNVRKVILLEIIKETPLRPSGFEGQAKEIQAIADQLLPKGKAREWNQALMDYAALVLKEKKVPLKKQSRFQGSNRYYRGKLLRLLLAEGPLSLSVVGKKLRADFSSSENEWLHQMIVQMEREGFVRIDGEKVLLMV